MRHRMHGRKFSRTSSHRRHLLVNLAKSLLKHEQIQTTLAKAKDLRPFVEKIITQGRLTSLHSRRRMISLLGDAELVEKVLSVLSPRYQDRSGGYTRIVKSGTRDGDNASMAYISFVEASAEKSADS